MAQKPVGAVGYRDRNDGVIHPKLLEHVKTVHHVAEGSVAAVHQVQTCWRQFSLVEKHEELGGAIIQGLIRMGPSQGSKGGERKGWGGLEQADILKGFVVDGVLFFRDTDLKRYVALLFGFGVDVTELRTLWISALQHVEILSPDEEDTIYNETFEDVGLFKATPTLPFATLGTLGWAHSDQALDDGSSQFFMFLYEAELTPAGLNLVDGRNAAFGYVVDGFDVLEELGVDDSIVSIKVTDGADRLLSHA